MDNETLVYKQILDSISPRIRNALLNLQVQNIQEIRLRANSPVVIVNSFGSSFITKSGRLTQIISDQCIICNEYEITDTLNKACSYSLHAHSKELQNGFVTIPCGARIGVCGTAVYENDILKSVKDITCLNIRIPRNISGSSNNLIDEAFSENLSSLLIVGPPSSGKTTLIKDLAFQISDGKLGKYYKVCVIDERFEFSKNASSYGPNTDIIRGFTKEKAISIAIRTMSPDIIICDEVALNGEIEEIIFGINSGVKFILTAHSNEDDFYKRDDLIKLCRVGGIEKVAFLYGSLKPGKVKKVISSNEFNKMVRSGTNSNFSEPTEYKLYKTY